MTIYQQLIEKKDFSKIYLKHTIELGYQQATFEICLHNDNFTGSNHKRFKSKYINFNRNIQMTEYIDIYYSRTQKGDWVFIIVEKIKEKKNFFQKIFQIGNYTDVNVVHYGFIDSLNDIYYLVN